MKKSVLLFLALLFVLCCSPGTLAENGLSAGEEPPKLRALLIGCDHFLTQEDTWPAAEHNIRLLSDTLISDRRRYALIRSSSSVIASVEAFEEAVLNTFRSARENDISLLYISTHGVYSEEDGTAGSGLILSDGREEALLTAPELQRVLDQIAGTKMVILDACNSGAVIGKGLSSADTVFLSGPAYKVLCSAGGSEASWYFQSGSSAEAAGASYFASVLTNGLGAQGSFAADQNDDGEITLREACSYLLDNYAASTTQAYPQNDGSFVLFSYDPAAPRRVNQAVTDLSFDDTLLIAGKTEVSFSFTVQRQAELYYQIVYHRDGAWQFDQAQHFLDGEQADGTVLPGRKTRTLSLETADDASGYAILQLITLEDGTPVFQGARLLCVQPASGEAAVSVSAASAFRPDAWQELPILVRHDVPCGLTVNILNAEGRTVRRLAYETPSRPQQLSPAGSTFYWDGMQTDGSPAPAGQYTVQAKVRLGGGIFTAESEQITLLSREGEQESGVGGLSQGSGTEEGEREEQRAESGTERKKQTERPFGQVFRSVRSTLNAVLSAIGNLAETLANTRPNQTSP